MLQVPRLSSLRRFVAGSAFVLGSAGVFACNTLVMPLSDDPNPPAPSVSGAGHATMATLGLPVGALSGQPTPRPIPTSVPAPPPPPTPPPSDPNHAGHDHDEKVQASHILVSWKGCNRTAQTRTQDEAKKRVAEILAKLKKGEDFGKLAGEYGEDGTKTRGGDLGLFARQDMVKPFADAAFALPVGGVSGIVTTDFGYHVIKRTK